MRSNFKSNTKKKMVLFAILLILFLGVGFAYLSQSLKINNTATIATNAWNIHLENVVVREGSVEANPPVIGEDKISVSASVTLNKPLDFYEYSVDVVNEGTLDAKLDTVVKTILTEEQKKYLNYTITYKDHTEIKKNDLLAPEERETLRIVIEMKDVVDASYLPTEAVTLTLEGQLNYVQDDGKGTKRNTNSLYQQIAQETQSDTGINFGAISSDTNGKGVYTLSKTINTANPVLYYRGNVTNNNVIFGGFCWKIIRTTETGGIKLIYNGTPTDGTCNNTGEATEIGRSAFNTESNDIKSGYMYDNNTVDSTIKGVIDSWFESNLVEYQDYLEDTPFYNANDTYTLNNSLGNGALIYPVGLITTEEVRFAGGREYKSQLDTGENTSFFLYTESNFWLFTPTHIKRQINYIMYPGGFVATIAGSTIGGVRPVISLQSTSTYLSGNGTSNSPYKIMK